MKKFYQVIFGVLFVFLVGNAFGQFTVTGKVTDASSNETLIGVTVLVKGTALGTTTDINGDYSLNIPTANATLVFTYVGYGTKEMEVSSSNNKIDMALSESISTLEEVVITGLATSVKRSNSANSVESISSRQLTEITNQQTMEGALYGKFKGAEVKATSGAPGGGFSIKMRGISSLFANSQPLYIVDGVFMNNSTVSSGTNLVSEAAGGGNTATNQDDAANRIADLDPEDIENIEILKGASAAAIYGSRAAGGVVIITTKKGKAGRTSVNFSQTFGLINPISLLGTRDWTDDRILAVGGQDALDAKNANGLNDYEAELYDNTGINSTSRLELSGGNASTQYFFGATYKNEDGIVENTGYEKASFKLNLTQSVTDWLDVDITTNYIDSEADRGFFNNGNTNTTVGYALAFTYPWEDLFPDDQGVYPAGGAGSNVLETVNLITNRESTDRFIGGATANLQLYTDERNSLKLVARGGLDSYSLKNTGIFPQELSFYRDPNSLRGVLLAGNTTSFQSNLSAFAVYSHYLPSGTSLRTTAGVTREDVILDNVLTSANGLIGSQTNVDQADNVSVNQTKREEIYKGFFVQEEVNFNDKVIATVGIRGDKTSNNGDSNELFTYPKANVAVNLHEFDFWNSSKVTTLKPRIAYGESMRPPTFAARFNTLGATFIGQNSGSITATDLGNPDILPERQKELEFGLDIGALDNRFVLDFTYYIKTIEDLLVRAQIQPSTGFVRQWLNGGELENKGVEIGLNAIIIPEGDLTWNAQFNFWKNQSEVTKLDIPAFNTGGFAASLGQVRVEQGLPATTIVGTYLPDNPQNLELTEDEAFAIYGDAEADFNLSWSNFMSWKDWDFNMIWHWKQGGDAINLSTLLYDLAGTTWDYDDIDLDPDGQMGNGDYRTSQWFAGNAGPWIEDAGYIRMREVAVYYTFPTGWSDGKSKIKLGVSGQNLINIFDYNSYDPEVSNFGGDVLANNVEVTPFPSSKRLNFHLKAYF